MLISRSLTLSVASTLVAALAAAAPAIADVPPAAADAPSADIEEVIISSQRLDAHRSDIEARTGASTYTIDSAAILAAPGGANAALNQVILQAPDVVQDSFGQVHVRGDHNDLQYRLNGIMLPEGISGFGQSLSPRLIDSLRLVTGALPAQYGLRTAGIVDMATRRGAADAGGTLALYGGSHGTVQPSFDYGGRTANLRYFYSGDVVRNALGIESPDGAATALHDHATQWHGFGYLERLLDEGNRLSLILGTSGGEFQIPDLRGLQPSLGLTVNGQHDFPSGQLDQNQRELTHYAVGSWQHSTGRLDWQSSLTGRYSSLDFRPDALGDLLYNGIAQQAYRRNVAFGWQNDMAWHRNAMHTYRAGFYLQRDLATSRTNSQVLAVAGDGTPLSDVPVTVGTDSLHGQWLGSLYLQDEWQPLASLTVNYGLRGDAFSAYTRGSQLSPRLNAVWQASDDVTVHAGYARYFTPPPAELVTSADLARYLGTSAAPASTLNDLPRAERSDYLDIGLDWTMSAQLHLGLDSYLRRSSHLLDEGQFGAPIILTPYNYRDGRIRGIEFTASYARDGFSAYGNLAVQSAQGRGIESSQFNFSLAELDYIATHYIHLDHEQRLTASAGASWAWSGTRISADLLLGSGLRANLQLADGSDVPNGAHLPGYLQLNLGVSRDLRTNGEHVLTARCDIINALDRVYEIRDGTGVGVGAPQFGARRGLFIGLSQAW